MKTNRLATPEEEAEQLLSLTKDDLLRSIETIERQLFAIYQRAQILLSLAGVVLTVTGFSGRIIAGTSLIAQILVISGLATVLASAMWVYMRVMSIRWVTTQLCEDPVECLVILIERRNYKTKAFWMGGKILCVGLILYCASVSLMLLNPN